VSMSREHNELITRVVGDAPMGQMLRQNFWFPVVLSQEITPGGAPKRVRVLGANFVVFRTGDGRVGCFNERCPHRGASLALARNEDNALRCIFHGWKYSVTGEVLEVPTEPHNMKEFCKSVPLRHYPVREACHIVWVWFGSGAPARFPDFEFNTLPAENTYAVRQVINCNWLQDVEGGMDSAHLGVLHQTWLKDLGDIAAASENKAPIYEFDLQPGGYRYAAIRQLANGSRYVRVNRFVLPWFSLICPEQVPRGDRLVIFSTPIDDEHTIHWLVRYSPYGPVKPFYHAPTGVPYINPVPDPANWPPAPPGGPEESWGQDRFLMANGHFSGFRHLNTEDFAVAESQGAIADRSLEYLSSGDLAVVRLRKQLLECVKQFVAGKPLSLARHENIPYEKIRAVGDVLEPGRDWHALSA
jgi:phthalate 4,5-dioxygenase